MPTKKSRLTGQVSHDLPLPRFQDVHSGKGPKPSPTVQTSHGLNQGDQAQVSIPNDHWS